MSTMIGSLIKKRRVELGVTQEELAIKLGYKSKSTINKIELGINDINQTKIKAFAKALDVPIQYFLDDYDMKSAIESHIPELHEIIENSNNQYYLRRIIAYFMRFNRIKKDMTEKNVSQNAGMSLEEYMSIEEGNNEADIKNIDKLLPNNSLHKSYIKGLLSGLDYTLSSIDDKGLDEIETNKLKSEIVDKAINHMEKGNFKLK